MKIYLIALTEYSDVSGEGAKRYGGRWNLPGHPVLYGASSVAAGLLERLTIDPELFSSERYTLYSVMELQCDDGLIHRPATDELPGGWNAIPATRQSQVYGTKLILSGVLGFQVPSVVDVTSWNVVINPLAKEFNRVGWKVYPLSLDQRIVR
jgi:RES domain-containing protein